MIYYTLPFHARLKSGKTEEKNPYFICLSFLHRYDSIRTEGVFMEKIVINGGTPLRGSIEVSGMKNAALAIIFATVLVEDTCIIENLPDISDVAVSLEILSRNKR